MQIIRNISSVKLTKNQRTVLTIGSYDGIHRGHKQIIAELNRVAKAQNMLSALITFYPRPKTVLNSHGHEADYLTTIEEKTRLLEELGLDMIAVLPFSKEFAKTTAQEFVSQLVNAFHPTQLWVGPDFKLGKGREGNIDYLSELGKTLDFSVKVINLQTINGEIISSTKIREAMKQGEIRKATRLLGNYPFLQGKVVTGAQRGRQMGFRTANIVVSGEKLLPANGVYAVWIHVDGNVYPAVANIGVRPTFGEMGEQTVEVHIFEFNRDIYNQTARVEWVEYLRPEQKFNGIEALIAQINADSDRARQILAIEKRP